MSIEAMKQAMEALEYAMEYNRCDDLLERIKQTELRADKAIASLRQAIEQAEKQEPVAMVGSGHQLLWTGVATYADHARQHGIKVGSLLYTDPTPQREWVGLTDEEAMQICEDCGCMSQDWLVLLDAIEAKLKEKNT